MPLPSSVTLPSTITTTSAAGFPVNVISPVPWFIYIPLAVRVERSRLETFFVLRSERLAFR